MKKRYAFEIKVVLVIAALVIMVSAAGLFAYRSLTGIVNDVGSALRPDTKLNLLKQIFADLSDAESSVKSYNLTQNNDYLSPFYSSIASIDDKMNELKQLSNTDPEQGRIADTINSLIEKKYEQMGEMLSLHNDESISNELNKISISLEEKRSKQTNNTSSYPEVEKKSNIFRKIFGKKETAVVSASASASEKQTVNIKDVRKAIEKATQEQSKRMQEIHEKELALTQQGKEVMDKIRDMIVLSEKNELDFISEKTKQAENRARETNMLITLFCVTIVLLLLIVSFVIVRYVNKNLAYSKALSEAKTEAENLAKARERFLANMSHEIRTPMNAIAGFTEQVLLSELNSEQRGQLEIVKKSSDHLLKIINDVLDFSKIQAGKLPIELHGFHLHEIINDLVLLVTPQVKNKNLDLTYQISPGVPEILIGDSVRLKQILLNLLSNAIKFTHKGEINLQASCTNLSENKTLLMLKIQDTGIGISPEKLDHIFEEFEQADDSISKKYGGTGLGLTITKRLIELQGGSISVSSEHSQGTVVSLSIPYLIGSQKDVLAHDTVSSNVNLLQGKKVLVADDEEYNRMLIASILKKWEIKFDEVQTGEAVLDAVLATDYDLILMDVLMPGMDGISATKKIREMRELRKDSIPILALTAIASEEDIVRCKSAGMNDVLPKPFKEKMLYEKMLHVLNIEIQSKEGETVISNNNHSTKSYSLDGLKHITNGDEAFLKELIVVFIESAQSGLKHMHKACEEKNWDVVADYAHKIVSPCVHFEAKNLVDVLKTIEKNCRNRQNVESVPILLKQATAEADSIIKGLEKSMADNVFS